MDPITTTGKGKGNGVPKRVVSPNRTADFLNLSHSAGCLNFARIEESGSVSHHCSFVSWLSPLYRPPDGSCNASDNTVVVSVGQQTDRKTALIV